MVSAPSGTARVLLAFDGQLERARGIVESCAPGNYAIVPTSSNYSMFTLAVLADVVGELNDPVLAAPLLDRLLPYAHLTALAPPEASAGALARPIAVLHGVLGQLDEAERSFDTALRMHREMGARPWEAHTHHQYAQHAASAWCGDEERVDKAHCASDRDRRTARHDQPLRSRRASGRLSGAALGGRVRSRR